MAKDYNWVVTPWSDVTKEDIFVKLATVLATLRQEGNKSIFDAVVFPKDTDPDLIAYANSMGADLLVLVGDGKKGRPLVSQGVIWWRKA